MKKILRRYGAQSELHCIVKQTAGALNEQQFILTNKMKMKAFMNK